MRSLFVLLLAALAATTAIATAPPHAQAQEDPDDVVRAIFDELEAGDVAGTVALVTDDILLTEIGTESFALVGKDAFEFAVTDVTTNNATFSLSNVQVDDQTVTARLEWSDDLTDDAGISRYIELVTATVTDDGLISRFDFVYDQNDAQTRTWLEYLAAQEEEEEGGPDEGTFTLVALAAQPGGSQPGDAFILEFEGGVTGVGVEITAGPAGVQQPAHFHTGTCAAPGPIVHPLANILDGSSFTILSEDYSELIDSGLIINVHKSVPEASEYVACGVVEVAAAAPTSTPAGAAPTATPATGIAAPDTGSGPDSGREYTWLLALLVGGAVLLSAGVAVVATGGVRATGDR